MEKASDFEKENRQSPFSGEGRAETAPSTVPQSPPVPAPTPTPMTKPMPAPSPISTPESATPPPTPETAQNAPTPQGEAADDERPLTPEGSLPQSESPSARPAPAATGALLVEVTTARQSLPIEGARVTVKSSKTENDLLRTLYTDRSGRTEKMLLPAKAASLSESPGNTDVYEPYDIVVEKEGYYTAYAFSVPVFAGITSLQPIALIPLSAYEPDKNRPDIGIEMQEKEPRL